MTRLASVCEDQQSGRLRVEVGWERRGGGKRGVMGVHMRMSAFILYDGVTMPSSIFNTELARGLSIYLQTIVPYISLCVCI